MLLSYSYMCETFAGIVRVMWGGGGWQVFGMWCSAGMGCKYTVHLECE